MSPEEIQAGLKNAGITLRDLQKRLKDRTGYNIPMATIERAVGGAPASLYDELRTDIAGILSESNVGGAA